MADWNLPATTTTYVNVLANLKDRDLDSAKLFDGVTVTNPATGMIRWSSANARLEKWNGTAWVALAATHAISISGSSASCTGNAATATALATARTINGIAFDGTANITVADATKLPLAGGTVSGDVIFDSNDAQTITNEYGLTISRGTVNSDANSQLYIAPRSGGLGRDSQIVFGATFSDGWAGPDYVERYSGAIRYGASGGTGSPRSWSMRILTGGDDTGDTPKERMRVSIDGAVFDGAVYAPAFVGPLAGNAATATALQTARTINGIAFDGSANITIPTAPPVPGTLSGTAIAWGDNAKWHATVSANTTFSFSSAPAVGTTCLLHVTHTAGTIAFPSTWVWPGNVAPSLTTGRVHLFAAYYDGAKYRASYLRNYPL